MPWSRSAAHGIDDRKKIGREHCESSKTEPRSPDRSLRAMPRRIAAAARRSFFIRGGRTARQILPVEQFQRGYDGGRSRKSGRSFANEPLLQIFPGDELFYLPRHPSNAACPRRAIAALPQVSSR